MPNHELQNICFMCGKTISIHKNQILIEKIDGTDYAFDSESCALIFKKFKSLYGSDFG